MKKSMRSQSKENVIKGSPRYFVGALPYRLCIRKPLAVSQTDRPDKIMDDSDFKNSVANCNSFRAFMLGFLRNYEDFHTYDDASLGIRIPQVEIDDTYQNEIRCSIYTGKYGYESELRNIKKSTQVKTRTVDDCELMPFACRIVFPRGHENCIVIFEKFGNNSCVGVFVRALREYVNTVFKDNGYKVNYGYITNLKYVMKQFRDNVRSIRFVRYSKLTDEFDFIDDDSTDKELKIEFKVSAQRGGALHLIDSFRDFTKTGFPGIVVCDQQFTNLSLEMRSKNRTQTIPAGSDAFQVPFDVSDFVECSTKTGLPTAESFFKASQQCLEMSLNTINGRDQK